MAGIIRRTLVVAKWAEDTKWTLGVPVPWRPMIVQKGDDIPNVGREPASFLWAMQRLYDKAEPQDYFAFVQGHPFAHCQDLFTILKEHHKPFRWLGDWEADSDATGIPHHPGLPIAEKHQEWFGRKFPGTAHFAPGGQFVIHGSKLLSHSKEFYQKLQDDMDDPLNPWAMERLWACLFSE